MLLGWTATAGGLEKRQSGPPRTSPASCRGGAARAPRACRHSAAAPVEEEQVYFDLCLRLRPRRGGPALRAPAARMERRLVRLSASLVSNVSAGGGVTGLVIVDGARAAAEGARLV